MDKKHMILDDSELDNIYSKDKAQEKADGLDLFKSIEDLTDAVHKDN